MEELEHKIPHSLVFLIPQTPGEGSIIRVYPVDKTRWGKQQEKSITSRMSSNSSIPFHKVEVQNSGFEIELLDNSDTVNWIGNIDLKISHPDLDRYLPPGKSLVIQMAVAMFIAALKSTGYVSAKKLHGTWCLEIPNNYDYQLVLETPELEESKKIAALWAGQRKTRKWIPGHMYLTKDFSRVLYLGDHNSKYRMAGYGGSKLFRPFFCHLLHRYAVETKSSHLVIVDNECGFSELSRLNKNSGIDIIDFLGSYLQRAIELYGPSCYPSILCEVGLDNLPPAVDLGEYLNPWPDSIDFGNALKSCLAEVSEAYISTLKDSSISIKEDWISLLSSRDNDIFNRRPELREEVISAVLEGIKKHVKGFYPDPFSSRARRYSTPESILENYTSIGITDLVCGPMKVVDMSEEELKEKLREIIKEVSDGK